MRRATADTTRPPPHALRGVSVVVRDSQDAVDRAQRSTLRTALGRQPAHTLHFRKLTHSQKVKACQDVAGFSIDMIANVVMAKARFAGAKPAGGTALIKHADPMYLYAVRLLPERLSWYVDEDGGGPAIVTFAHLTRFPAAELHNYRRALELSVTQIRWNAFAGHRWRIEHPNTIDLLQLADATASALFNAVDPDRYGNTEDRYLRALAPKLYRRGSANITSYGLKVLPTSECQKGGSLEFLRAF